MGTRFDIIKKEDIVGEINSNNWELNENNIFIDSRYDKRKPITNYFIYKNKRYSIIHIFKRINDNENNSKIIKGTSITTGESWNRLESLGFECYEIKNDLFENIDSYEKELKKPNTKFIIINGKKVTRSDTIIQFIKKKAKFKCELCEFTFKKTDNSNYVEFAHIEPLANL